eukprot:scaffold297622_cov56-Attheya_sp.AAC.4
MSRRRQNGRGSHMNMPLQSLLIGMLMVVGIAQGKIVAPTSPMLVYDSIPALFGKQLEMGVDYSAHLQVVSSDLYLCGDSKDRQELVEDHDPTPDFVKIASDFVKIASMSMANHGIQLEKEEATTIALNINRKVVIPSDKAPVVLLAKRGICSFEEKVRTAMSLEPKTIGRKVIQYLIVYDDEIKSDLVPMSVTDGSGIDVSSFFVSTTTGQALLHILLNEPKSLIDWGGTLVRIDSSLPTPHTIYDDLREWVVVALYGFFFFASFYGCLMIFVRKGYIHTEGNTLIIGPPRGIPEMTRVSSSPSSLSSLLLTEAQVLHLPEVTYFEESATLTKSVDEQKSSTAPETCESIEANQLFEQICQRVSSSVKHQCSESKQTDTMCSICLEEYDDGEVLRVLPCNHNFHTCCIVPWLTEQHANCPLCKHSLVNPSSDEEEWEDIEDDVRPTTLRWRRPINEVGMWSFLRDDHEDSF